MSYGVSVLVPTKKRPKRLEQLISSIQKTAKGVEVLTYVDEDDDSYSEWTVKGPSFERARMFRALFEKASNDYLMICGDDVVFETPDWNEKMAQAIPEDGIGAVFGFDGWKNVPGHLLFHRRFVDLTGAFPDDFEHFGIDTYISDVMRGVERLFQVNVMCRHLHHRNGKAENDETYSHTRTSGMSDRDRVRLEKHRKGRMKEDIRTLKAEIERFSSRTESGGSGAASARDQQTTSL